MLYIFSLLLALGLAVGSFFNVVAFRFKENGFLFGRKRLGGRSRCLYCGKNLKWYELVPVLSFLIQLGRCRHCSRRLSFQYPLVEIISGLIFFLVPFYFLIYKKLEYWNLFQSHPALFYFSAALWILVFAALLLLSVIDFREYLVPDELIYILFFLGLVWTAASYGLSRFYGFLMPASFLGAYSSVFTMGENIIWDHLFGAFMGAAVIALIFYLSRGRAIGFGDVLLLGALGLLFGWPDIIIILMVAFVLGAMLSCGLLVRKVKGFKDFVPFAPFLALASFLVFFWGEKILQIYFDIFHLV